MLNYISYEQVEVTLRTAASTVIIIFLMSINLYAEKIYCDQCGNVIKAGSTYITSGDKIFCDEECYEKSLPKCAVCNKPVRQGYIQDGKNYCSEECLKTTWEKCSVCGERANHGMHFGSKDGPFYCMECSRKPVCFACNLPNECTKLKDGRNICSKCRSASVSSFKEAMDLIRDVRKVMKEELGLATNHEIKYFLVDQNTLKAQSKNSNLELGLFVLNKNILTQTSTKTFYGYEFDKKVTTTEKDSFYIYLLTDLPKDKFIEVAAHELTHDWMSMAYPNIYDLKISEGWAEFTASRINSHYGNGHLNIRMLENADPVYGEGYRFIAGYVKQYGMNGLTELFKKENKK